MSKSFQQQPKFSYPITRQHLNNNSNINNEIIKDLTNCPWKKIDSSKRYESQTKKILRTALNSNCQQNQQSSERQLLSYSNTTQFTFIQDSSCDLKKLLNLMSSKQNLRNHISQSISLLGYSSTVSNEFGNLLSNSFIEYTELAKKIQQKLKKEQINIKDQNNASYVNDINNLNARKATLQSEIKRMEQERDKIIKKNSQCKSLFLNHSALNIIKNSIEQSISSIIEKTIIFQSKVYLKLGHFQDSLINLTKLRNNILHDKVNDDSWQQNCRKYESQNKKLQKSLKEKEGIIQNYVVKQKKWNSQLIRKKNDVSIKDEQIKDLKIKIQMLKKELEEQRSLYDNMIEKNLNLEKQLFLLSNQNNMKIEGESFQITEKQQIIFLGESGIGLNCLCSQSSQH